MKTTKSICLIPIAALLLSFSMQIGSVGAQTATESERLGKLERAVEQLQKRNAELESEVRTLKGRSGAVADVDAQGNKKPQVSYDGKTYVEKNAPAVEKKAGDKWKLSTALTEIEL